MKKFIVLCLSVVFALNISAQTATPESINKLLDISGAKESVDAVYSQVGQMFEGMAAQLGVTDAERPLLNQFNEKMEALLKAEAGWDKMQKDVAAIYTKNFTEEEVQGLIKFYESPAGKAFVSKMPVVQQESIQMSQQLMVTVMPKIQALAEEFGKEIQKSRQK